MLDLLKDWFEFIGLDWENNSEEQNEQFFNSMDKSLLITHALITTTIAFENTETAETLLNLLKQSEPIFKTIVKNKEDYQNNVVSYISALEQVNKKFAEVIYFQNEKIKTEKETRKNNATLGARAKHENSDYAKPKAEILKAWQEKREVLIKTRGKAQFCRDMQKKYKDVKGNEIITEVNTIKDWITKYEKSVVNKS